MASPETATMSIDMDMGVVSPRQQVTRSSLRSIQVSSPSQATHGTGAGTEEKETGRKDPAAAVEESVSLFPSIDGGLESLNLRPDPDAQATVTDFLDFTEYLPSDIMRSLTLIGDLDEKYVHASTRVHELTARWGQLPMAAPETRPEPVALRADISASLRRGLSSRIYAHDEAQRMAKNVDRHYHRAKTILEKLRAMLENYAEAEAEQQEQQEQQKQREEEQKQKQQQQLQARGEGPGAAGGGPKQGGAARVHRQRVPRITVPGEVLAPYDVDYEMLSDESDVSSPSSSDESPPPPLQNGMGPYPRIKVHKAPGAGGLAGSAGHLKPPKPRVPRAPRAPRPPGEPYQSTSYVLAQLKPPPENAVAGSTDAPWLRLTPYELAKLRKRMKKNAQWAPSETMIARELKMLGRNLEAFNEAKRRAEMDGQSFDGLLPETVVEADGVARAPLGALSMDAAMEAEHKQLTNRGMKLNEAKKLKNNMMAHLAAQEAEESARKMIEQARAVFSPYAQQNAGSGSSGDVTVSRQGSLAATTRATTPMSRKRKRESATATALEGDGADKVEGSVEGPSVGGAVTGGGAQQRQLPKRVKTETPVPIPQHAVTHETPVHPPYVRHSATPVPAPTVGQEQSAVASLRHSSSSATSSLSPLSVASGSGTAVPTTVPTMAAVTTTVPTKPPAATPVSAAVHSPRKSTTPIHPPVRELRTREAVRKSREEEETKEAVAVVPTVAPTVTVSKPPSRAATPVVATVEDMAPAVSVLAIASGSTRRPSSRGASLGGAELEQTLASERSRRASAARLTPAPEAASVVAVRMPSKRVKRPAPGVVSRTSSGGSAAVGRRKAAPRKKRGSHTHPTQTHPQTHPADEVEVDDDGNIIDADEPRYCVCNRVSFGTMIQCDNVENCRQEWFHLECVGLTAVPARTTKWYCPDCRVLLKIGEKGEVSARGVRM